MINSRATDELGADISSMRAAALLYQAERSPAQQAAEDLCARERAEHRARMHYAQAAYNAASRPRYMRRDDLLKGLRNALEHVENAIAELSHAEGAVPAGSAADGIVTDALAGVRRAHDVLEDAVPEFEKEEG